MSLRFRILALAALISFHSLAPAADGFIWVEGESAKEKKLQPHGWYESVKKGLLSGNAFAANYGPADGLVSYDVQAPADAEYTLWVRANHVGAKLSYKLNTGDWTPVDFSRTTDQVNLASDSKPDMRFVAWVNAGKVKLQSGANAVSFKMHSANQHHGALDCFVFASKPFTPMGATQPGKKLGLADPGMWAFEPDADEFDSKALLDLRSLNEKHAGESGWLQRTADGGFALGSGQPVRFWAANSGVHSSAMPDDLKTHARFLAKRGINMVRFHGSIWPKKNGSKITDVDEVELEKIQRTVAAMKKEGIYTTLSPYWAIPAAAQQSWNIPGKSGGNMPGLLFWDETLQAGYKAWIKEILTRKSPYGPPLGQDPALGIFQIQNEDSLLFWTLGAIKGEEKKRLCQHQGKWAVKKYGSLEKAREAWMNAGADGDDFANGAVGIIGLWEWNGTPTGGKAARMADQLQWLSETMHAFNKSIDDFIHIELGCKVLINAGNWYTANQIKMLDCERWSYTANQVTGKNNYVTGIHINPSEGHKSGYLVSPGDFYTDTSTTLLPRKLPTNVKQTPGSPFIISESTWVPPMLYQSEGPFMIAAYSSLTGMDVFYWFSLGNVGFDRTINKWQVANPAIMGGWPAAALMFRKGYIAKGEPAIHEERALDDMWRAKGILIAEDETFDPNRHSGSFAPESNLKEGASPLAFLVGPVEVVYGGDPAKSHVVDLKKYIDDSKKTVNSITGELKLDHGNGLCTLDAPKAQGATGFLKKAGAISLKSLAIDSANDYATLLAVSMDGKDLSDSQQILVQSTTTCRPYKWKSTPAEFQDKEKKNKFHGLRIDDIGQEPWNVAINQTTIQIKNAALTKAIVLDPNGMPTREIDGENKGGIFTLKLPPDTLYLILKP